MNTRTILAAVTSALALATGSLGLNAGPSFGADNVTINAAVGVAAPAVPCISISGSNTFGFGLNAAFSKPGAANQVTLPSDQVDLSTACATVAQNILMRSSAFSNGTGGSWALNQTATDICAVGNGVDRTTLRVSNIDIANADTQIGSAVAANNIVPATATLRMPCQGSSGGGTTMSSTVTVTAVIS